MDGVILREPRAKAEVRASVEREEAGATRDAARGATHARVIADIVATLRVDLDRGQARRAPRCARSAHSRKN